MNIHVKNYKGKAILYIYIEKTNMDETMNNVEERQDAPMAPEISDWQPSAPPEDGSPPDYYTAFKLPDVPSDIPPPPEYSPPSIQGTWTGILIFTLLYYF